MSEPISVVHFFRRIRAEDGGVVRAVLDLCQMVAARGHRVTLATLDATDVPKDWLETLPNVPEVLQLDASAWSSALLSEGSLERFAQVIQQANLAHLHVPWGLCNLQLASVLQKAAVPYIVSIHGVLDDYSMRQKPLKKRVFMRLFGRRLLRHATTVHFTAEAERDQALRWIPGTDHSAIQACAMDLAPFECLPGPQPALEAFPQIRPDSHKILFLSRIHPKKGVELLLEAGAILRDQGLPIQLLIAGPGDDSYVRQLKSLTSRLGLDDHTEFLGMVRGIEKRSLFQLSDVFVLPTYQENFGLVIAEAMACGTPVVTTRGTDIWREIERGGARIADMNPESLATQMRGFLTDKETRDRVGQQGFQFLRQWLDSDDVINGYEQVHHDTVHKGPRK